MSHDDGFDPPPGVAEAVAPGVRRVLAPNPSPMTYRGTNSYIIGRGRVALIDPGPDSVAHRDALLAALEPFERITHIFVTHSHLDHAPLAGPLSRDTGAPVLAFGATGAGRAPVMRALAESGVAGGGEGADDAFAPDHCLADGETVAGADWRLTALWTPGHMSNHLCFAWGDVVFTGDHVMGWASSLVSPPDGDLTAYMASLGRLAGLDARLFLPGHGAPVTDTAGRLRWLTEHRRAREAQILAALAGGAADAATLTRRIYVDTPAPLLPAAERNVFAHLVDLSQRGAVSVEGALAPEARFSLRAG